MRKLQCFLFTIIISFITICSGCGFNGNCSSDKTLQQGDLAYRYLYDDGIPYVAILELTEEGKRKETIIIPEEIDGKPVIQIGMSVFMGGFQLPAHDAVYKKLYLPKTLMHIVWGIANNGSKTFIIELENMKLLTKYTDKFYLSSSLYNEFIEEYEDYKDSWRINIANIEFVVYGQPYWIDDYDEQSLITAPENPVKDGYEFIGWFKEPECINEWDFEMDKVKGKTYDEEGNKNINLTRLYAKWQKV